MQLIASSRIVQFFSYPSLWHIETGRIQQSSLLFRVNRVLEKQANPPLYNQAVSGMYWEKRKGATGL